MRLYSLRLKYISRIACQPIALVVVLLLPASVFAQPIPNARPSHPPPPTERLVGEAPLIDDGYGLAKHVYLPVTIHGQPVSLLLDTGAPYGLAVSQEWLQEQGVPSSDVLDSLVIGNSVETGIPIDGNAGMKNVAGVPLVVGVAGNHYLAHHDLLFDGPAKRVQLYTADSTRLDGTFTTTAWLPPGIKPSDCTPLLHVGTAADRYPGLDLRANGKRIVSVFDLGSSATYMNVAAAKLLGIRQSTPHVYRVPPDSMINFPGVGENHEWILTTGLTLTIAGRPLSDTPVAIFQTVNEINGDRTKPELDLGTDLFHDRTVFISYSTQRVCFSEPTVRKERK